MSDKLALGTVQFGLDYGVANQSGQLSLAEVGEVLAYARDTGIDTLDTAIAYGESETILGQAGVAGWKVVTKLPAVPDDCPDVSNWVRTQMQASFARLKVQRVHAVLLHRPLQLFDTKGDALLAAFEQLKVDGQVAKVGVSVYSPEELERLFALHDFDLVQAPLNILDRRLLDSGWAAKLKHSGVEIHTRSTFLQGLLLMSMVERPVKFQRWSALWAAWDAWLKGSGLTPLQACLGYALSVDAVDKAIVGVDSLAQMQEICAAVRALPPVVMPDWSSLIDDELLNPAAWNTL